MDKQVQTDETFLQLMQLDKPQSVSMFPDTLAWKVIFALLIMSILIYFWRRYNIYQKELWKRQALKEALKLKNSADSYNWFILIKRVCLVYKTKEEVLKLNDKDLLYYLDNLDESLKESLYNAHYQKKAPLSKEDNQKIYKAFCIWIDNLEEIMDV